MIMKSMCQSHSKDYLANFLTFLLYPVLSSLNYIFKLLIMSFTAASTFAGESIFGSFNIEITLNNISSTVNIGLHLLIN